MSLPAPYGSVNMAKRRPPGQKTGSKPSRKPNRKDAGQASGVDAPMRIIGGRLKNKRIEYSGDVRTRPMKERVREAVFNLIGPSIKEKFAIDLFAGTGALGMEAISRGATEAILIERHVPTTKLIRDNAEALELVEQVTILAHNSFLWVKQQLDTLPRRPWCVFICPPYEFFASRKEDMQRQIGTLIEKAPEGSVLIVEFDEQFDAAELPDAEGWDVRVYWPAHVGIYRVYGEAEDDVEDDFTDSDIETE